MLLRCVCHHAATQYFQKEDTRLCARKRACTLLHLSGQTNHEPRDRAEKIKEYLSSQKKSGWRGEQEGHKRKKRVLPWAGDVPVQGCCVGQ